MPISTVCGDCQKKYTVKSEMAGKRFRCKDCEAIVTVSETAIDEEDPFASEELKSTGRPIRQYQDDEDEEEESSGRERRIRREAKAKPDKKKKVKGPAIPVSGLV